MIGNEGLQLLVPYKIYKDADMTKIDKLLTKILNGTSDANIQFDGLCQLLTNLGFDERIKGSHHIFTKEGIEEILNL